MVITRLAKYLEGIKSLLSDSSKFMQLPIAEDKWINYIIHFKVLNLIVLKYLTMRKKFLKKNFIVFVKLASMSSILFGNPKVQKTVINNTPKFRPILSAINTPTYLLAKYLNPILSPLTINKFSVRNSFDFAEEVVNNNHNLYLASFDVESLFTNIPLEETVKNCVNNL